MFSDLLLLLLWICLELCCSNRLKIECNLNCGSYRAVNTFRLGYKETVVAVCSEIRTQHIHKICGQNVEFLNV